MALVADSHFHEASRFEECLRLHDWIANDAAARGCNAWLHAGDVYEKRSTPIERDAVGAWVQQMGRLGPGVIVRGNHDAVDDLRILERLDTDRNPVHVVQDARVVRLPGVSIACLSWPQRARLAALLPDRSKEEVEAAAGDALRAVLRGLGHELEGCPESDCRLFLGHVMVRGSRTSVGQPLVGCDFELGLEDLALVGSADAFLLGHIHKGQDWDVAGAPAIYPGSPRRTAFGELEPKGYVVVEHDGHGLRWEFVEAPATPMVQLEAEYKVTTPAGMGAPAHHFVVFDTEDGQGRIGGMPGFGYPPCRGAEVRLRYRVADDQREAAAAHAEEWRRFALEHAGVLSVKVEEVVTVDTRARTPEVAAARTLTDKVQALWTAQQFDPGDRLGGLLAKLGEVEEEARHAA